MKAYKVLRRIGDELFSSYMEDSYALKYKLEVKNKPLPNTNALFAFKTLNDAKYYLHHLAIPKKDTKLELWECEVPDNAKHGATEYTVYNAPPYTQFLISWMPQGGHWERGQLIQERFPCGTLMVQWLILKEKIQ